VFVVGDIICEVGFMPIWFRLPGPRPQLLDGIFDLSFYRKQG